MFIDHFKNISRKAARIVHEPRLRGLRAGVAAAPLDPAAHRALASGLARAGRVFAAHAALRSAALLTADQRGTPQVTQHRVPADQLRGMNHNQYFRFQTLSRKLTELAGAEIVSVLDVGGGDGGLAQFLPDYGYFLAEPAVNGLSGEALPFTEGRFDYVVACHVLEHIAPEARHSFLDNLMLCARRGLVLLNPFLDERSSAEERLRLFIDVMDAPWAREHLECTLPKLEMVHEYAEDRGFAITTEPNGFMPFAAAIELANYFCAGQGRGADFKAINTYFNQHLEGRLDVADCPNAMLVVLTKHPQAPTSG